MLNDPEEEDDQAEFAEEEVVGSLGAGSGDLPWTIMTTTTMTTTITTTTPTTIR